MRKLIAILFFTFCNMLIAQHDIVETDSLLLWQSERKLTWDDFKGQSDKRSINIGAITQGKIAIVNTYWKNDVPKYDIRCYFVKHNSWNIVTDSLSLVHEQVHFDIFELYTRKIRNAFDSLNQKKVINNDVYNDLFQSYFKECSELQKEYDVDYFDKSTRQEWVGRITKELEELKEYEYKPKK